MKRRATRRRVEINMDELDGILDRSTTAPLSEAESRKLKAALHALADRLVHKRSTEKTKAVLTERDSEAGSPATESCGNGETAGACGHGRNGAAAFAGAIRVSVPHATLQPGQACPEMWGRESLPAKRSGDFGADCGASAVTDDGFRDGSLALQCLRASIHGGCARNCRRRQVRRDSHSHDRVVEVWHRC
jgi:hypothetical protein